VVINVVALVGHACKTFIDHVRLNARDYFFVDMNVLEDVGNHVVDAIKNVIISVVWLNARRDVGIFV